jgi:DNA-binding transcriptional regulator GbsR (MarR family)
MAERTRDPRSDRHRFIEDMSQHIVGWGLPRNTGRVYAYLLLQPEPASLDQMVGELGIAKSGASVAARQLVQLGMARTTGERGSRRLLYEALVDLQGVFAARNAGVQELVQRLREGARVAPPGPRRRQLEEMAHDTEVWLDEFRAFLRSRRDRRHA